MRLYLPLLLLMVFVTSDLSAQNEPKGISALRFGYQSTVLTSSDGNLFSNRDAFYIGAFREQRIIPLLRWSAGLEYFQAGAQDDDNSIKINYLQVPVGLNVVLGPVNAGGGIGLGFRIGDSQDLAAGDKYEVETFDPTAYAQIGVRFLFIGIDARYHWGLNEAIPGYKNQIFQIGLHLFI